MGADIRARFTAGPRDGPPRTSIFILYLLIYRKDSGILYLYIHSKGNESVPKVSSKRQITLPVDQCRQIGIEPGDDYQSFVANGQITIVKKVPGATRGILKHVKGNKSMTDEDSLQSVLD